MARKSPAKLRDRHARSGTRPTIERVWEDGEYDGYAVEPLGPSRAQIRRFRNGHRVEVAS